MYEEHSLFKSPENPDQLIWRYMDFTKFVDMLEKASLYFTRADCFEDIFEGSLTKMSKEFIEERIIEIKNREVFPENFDAERIRSITPARKQKAINCWHMNDFESAAMWKLYLQSNEGIAIQSTFSKLRTALTESELIVLIGKVNYIDYDKEVINPFNGFNSFLHKRKSFEHERELRVILWDKMKTNKDLIDLSDQTGCRIKVSLEELIQNIYVSPNSPLWFTNLVQEITLKYGISRKVINSRLNDTPIF